MQRPEALHIQDCESMLSRQLRLAAAWAQVCTSAKLTERLKAVYHESMVQAIQD